MKKLVSWDDVALKLPDVVRDWLDARTDAKLVAQHTVDSSTYGLIGSDGSLPGVGLIPANCPNIRKSVANVRAGLADMRILMIGDSTTQGGGVVDASTQSIAAYLTKLLDSQVAPAQPSISVCPYAAAVNDSRWLTTLPAGWNYAGPPMGLGSNSCIYSASTTPSVVTFTPGINCDTFVVWYLDASTGSSFTLQVDSDVATVVPIGATSTCKSVTVTAAAGTGHVLKIGHAYAGEVWIYAAEAYLSTPKSIRVGNVGIPGTSTGSWSAQGAFLSTDAQAAYAPDLTILQLGTNDNIAGQTKATYKAAMQTIITVAKNHGPSDILLWTCTPIEAGMGWSATLEADYLAANYELAASNNLPLVDLHARWADWPTANGLGFMTVLGAAVHPSQLGNADIAGALASAIQMLT